MYLFLLLLLCIIFFYFKVILPLNYWHSRGVFQVYPILRFFKSILCLSNESFSDIFHSMYTNHPNHRYIGTFIFTKPALFIRDLDLIKQLTIKDFNHFSDRVNFFSVESDPLLPLTMFELKGQEWRQVRSVLSPAFTTSKIKTIYPLISETAQIFCKYLEKKIEENGEMLELEIKELFEKYSSDVIVKGYFGIEVNSLKDGGNNKFLEGGKMFMKPSMWMLVKGAFFLLIPRIFRFFRITVLPAKMSKIFLDTISRAIKLREKSNLVRQDLMHLLIEAKNGRLKHENDENIYETGFATVKEYETLDSDQSGIELSTKIAAAQAMTLYLGGVATTSSFLEFIAYELARNPEVQSKLQQEIDKYRNEEITYTILTKMRYLDQTICEVLRKWSVAYVTSRICTKDYVIEPKKAGEKRLLVEKGCIILVPNFALHFDSDYFPEPEKFDPERFSETNKAKTLSGTFIPFGIGPRNCIASRFALLVVKVLIVNLFSTFNAVPVEKTEIPLQLANRLMVEPKKDVWLGLRKRF